MRDYSKQVEAGLFVCFERGEKALQLLAEEKVDEALDEMKRRKAAFKNFLVAEALLEDRFFFQKENVTLLFKKVKSQDDILSEKFIFLQNKTQADLQVVMQERKKVNCFHSGKQPSPAFQKTV